jgi:hypothetical protein
MNKSCGKPCLFRGYVPGTTCFGHILIEILTRTQLGLAILFQSQENSTSKYFPSHTNCC